MRYFPIFLDLDGRTVVIVGGGEEGLRKVRLLSRTGARILVIAEELHEELAGNARIEWLARRFESHLLDGAALVISADTGLNELVCAAARQRGIPINAVDRPDLSSFIVPSIVDRAPVVVAIGTEGTAPILGQGLRARIDAMLPPTLGKLAEAAGVLRNRVGQLIPAGAGRRSFWQRFFFGDVRDAFIAGEEVRFRSTVEALLTAQSVPSEGRVSFVSTGPGDADLLTIRAQRKLREADVLVHERSSNGAVVEMARRDAVRIRVEPRAFTAVTDVLGREAMAGRHVVRLHEGEVPVEELAAVAAEGIAVETVPGVAMKSACRFVAFPVRAAGLRAAS